MPRRLPLLLFPLLALLALWLYWPGQTGPPLLDDRAVLLPLSDLYENEELAWDFVFREKSGTLGRAVSMSSFVLEKWYLGDSVAITKQVNIILHLVNGALVAWLFFLLFSYLRTPACGWLAVLLAGIWLLSPLYVSTVLYAVQRMAMLATTFMLAACIAYCHWRATLLVGRPRHGLLLALLVLVLLAIFSKENGLLVVPVILLIEALWYQFCDASGVRIPWIRNSCLGLIIVGSLGLIVAFSVQYDYLAGRFLHRPFSLEERLLTQSRILWDYMAQFYWPRVQVMGIYHDDVEISRSLTQPVTTLYALLGWGLALASTALALCWRGGRYFALGLLWFLTGHSMEGGPFSLELYFEHRNYFPGVGLVMAVGVMFRLLVGRWQELRRPLLVYLSVYLFWLATLTSSEVQIWSSRPLLTFHHYNGHPQSYRATGDMAVLMATLGDMARARDYSRQSFESSYHERTSDQLIRSLALACIADQSVPLEDLRELGVAHPERPFRSPSGLLMLVRLLQDGECPAFQREAFADRMAEIFLAPDSIATASRSVFYALAVLENALQRYANAYRYNEWFLAQSPRNSNGLLMKLHFATALGKGDERADTIARLQELEQQGKLTVREQQTLSMYLEN